MAQSEADASMAPYFALALLALILIPLTWSKISSRVKKSAVKPIEVKETGTGWGERAIAVKRRSKPSTAKQITSHITGTNIALALLWTLFFLIFAYALNKNEQNETFEPFAILGLDHGASDSEIRKAYRELSRRYHPDKNPDPKAQMFFTEKVTKAYEALTDETAKKNYELYGHPDGRQAVNLGVALPTFFFEKGSGAATLILLGVTSIGVLLPLGLAVAYLRNISKFTQGRILHQTLNNYAFGLSDKMSPERSLEVICTAQELINMPPSEEQSKAVAELRKLLKEKRSKETTDPAALAKEKALLVERAHLNGSVNDISDSLWDSHSYFCDLFPQLVTTLVKLSLNPPPEKSRNGLGLLQPALSTLKLSQHLTHAVPLTSATFEKEEKKLSKHKELDVSSLQMLPHMDSDNLKVALTKGKFLNAWQVIRAGREARFHALGEAVGTDGMQDLEAFMQCVPFVLMDAKVGTEGENQMRDGDIVGCKVRVGLLRRNGSVAPSPMMPRRRKENWWVIVSEQSGAVLASDTVTPTELGEGGREMEDDLSAKVEGPDEEMLQKCTKVDLKFKQPKAGSFRYKVFVVSDFWVGLEVSEVVEVEVRRSDGEEAKKKPETGKERRQRLREGGGASGEDLAVKEEEDDDDDDEEEEEGSEVSKSDAESDVAFLEADSRFDS